MSEVQDPTTVEIPDYTEDHLEFINAMKDYQRENKRRFPSWSEAFEVLRSLGYRKVAEKSKLPTLTNREHWTNDKSVAREIRTDKQKRAYSRYYRCPICDKRLKNCYKIKNVRKHLDSQGQSCKGIGRVIED